jgi:RNA polymerase sigma factor (sigma-70 family)
MRTGNHSPVPANPGAPGLLPGMFPKSQGERSGRGLTAARVPTQNPDVMLRWGNPRLIVLVRSHDYIRHGQIALFQIALFQMMDLTEPSIERLRLKLRYKVLYHVGHNCADVDDLVQETLVRFFRAEQRKIIRNTDELGAFLNGVCRNVILEYRRRIRREPSVDPDTPIPDAGIRPEADILEMRDAIDNGLKELAERDRMILRSLYLEGKEKDAICKDWKMTDAQFRVVLFRAKERFRRAYTTEMKRSAVEEH